MRGLTVSELSRRARVTTGWIRLLIGRGELQAEKVGTAWIITPQGAAAWLARRQGGDAVAVVEMPDLPTVGFFVASRTGDTDFAAIARSSAPQLRYDALVANLVRTPQAYQQFSQGELLALVSHMADEPKSRRALDDVCPDYTPPGVA